MSDVTLLPCLTESSCIALDTWIVADVAIPKLRSLNLKGNLEFDGEKDPNTDEYKTFVLEVSYIIIEGGRLIVGWEEDRYVS